MHLPAPKSNSFGRGTCAISFGNLRSIEDCAKEALDENEKIEKINKLSKRIRRSLRSFLSMGYFSSKPRTIWQRAAWSNFGLRHSFRNKKAFPLSSSIKILVNLNVSSGVSLSMTGLIVIHLSPFLPRQHKATAFGRG
jgi:hypothetical protein